MISIASSSLGWFTWQTPVLLCLVLLLLAIRRKQKGLNSTRGKTQDFEPIPSPPQWPIIGHMYLLKDYQDNHWLGLDKIREKYGDVVWLQMGMLSMVMVSGYETMKEVLVQKGDIFCDRPNFERLEIVFGARAHSLALCDFSSVHKDRRKMCKRAIIPTNFSSRHRVLESVIKIHTVAFVKSIEDRIFQISETQKNSDIEKFTQVSKTDILFLTSDIFLDFLCKETRSHADQAYKKFNYGADFLFWDVQQSYITDFFPFLARLGVCRSRLSHLDQFSTELRNYVNYDVFNPRLEYLRKRLESNKPSPMTTDSSENFLDSMLTDYLSKSTSLELEDYRLGFADLYGGHAAVANILMRVLGHLSLSLDIQDKVYEEASRVDIGNLNHIPSLPLAESTLQESLRMASSPIVPHLAKSDSSLGPYFVPQGTTILFNNYDLNLSEKHWHDPKSWNPMRFIDEGTGEMKLPPHFMPYSIGMRHCLGYKMVNTICAMAVAYICKKFVIKSRDDNLTNKLLEPRGLLALNPDSECFELRFYLRR